MRTYFLASVKAVQRTPSARDAVAHPDRPAGRNRSGDAGKTWKEVFRVIPGSDPVCVFGPQGAAYLVILYKGTARERRSLPVYSVRPTTARHGVWPTIWLLETENP